MRFYRTSNDKAGGCERVEMEEAGKALHAGYVPSVTTVLGVIRHAYLENWLIKQSLEHFEENGDFKAALAFREMTAAEFGTACHALMEARLKGVSCNVEHDQRHLQACEPLWQWLDENVENVLFTEQQFADTQLGYGGTSDLLVLLKDGRQMLLDLKTKKNSPNYPLRPDMMCRYQISAYRQHFQKLYGPMSMGNLFIASAFGYLPQPKLAFFDFGEADWLAGFDAAHRLWWEQNGGEGTKRLT